jgi:hypothetical protein
VSVPIATATFRILRAAPGGEKWEPGPLATVGEKIRGNISSGRGVQSTAPGETTTTARYVLALDPFVPVAPFNDVDSGSALQATDVVEDEQTGERWSVESPHLRSVIPHWTAYVIRTDIR